jgi:CelD/BcsL family acetyltransferase involved in cellulose biosynthesis
VTILEPIANLAAARPLWTELARRSGNIFATWEWAVTWWRHFGGGGDPTLQMCLRDGEPFAIAPLYLSRIGPFTLLRFIGHGVGDVLGPICAPEDTPEAAEAMLAAVRAGHPRATALLAERMPSGAAADAYDGTLLQVEANPSLEISGRSWEQFLGDASRNMREKLKRSTRKLERDHEFEFELCGRVDRVEPMMRDLFALHAKRWDDGASIFTSSAVADFHLDFAAKAMESGWLRLWVMRVDGVATAAWYGFRYGEVEAYYQSGRDPEFDRYSVGFLMLMRTIKGAFDDGLDRYGFLRGDEPYKNRFATMNQNLETWAYGRRPLGRGVVRAGALSLQIAPMRNRLTSKFG